MSRFEPNPNMHDELERDPRLTKALGGTASDVARIAEGLGNRIMPRRRKGGGRAGNRKSFQVEGRRVVNTDHGAHIDEYGSANSRPYAPLRRAARAVGRFTGSAPRS